ncbi:hypothetical protein PILCRDRAFT_564471 [Piloderma croceum F 1598]|uniref:Uncharacterized protein n=1 Tax=Piloderma croceum (strain F 1598) TaxID=765440 RepID=A0A0C3FHR2_PILCF|nr:hypothetical protein PILCRDRAFT_564471 [Piloderma croceum F 1598]
MISTASGRNGSPGPTSAGYKGQQICHTYSLSEDPPFTLPEHSDKTLRFQNLPFAYHKWILSPSCPSSPRPATLSLNPPLTRRRVREDLAMGTVLLFELPTIGRTTWHTRFN